MPSVQAPYLEVLEANGVYITGVLVAGLVFLLVSVSVQEFLFGATATNAFTSGRTEQTSNTSRVYPRFRGHFLSSAISSNSEKTMLLLAKNGGASTTTLFSKSN